MSKSYIDFVKAGGGIIVDTRTAQNPKEGKDFPVSCTMITANDYIIGNAKKMEAKGDNKYIHVEEKDGYAVIRGVPYRSRKKTGVDANGKALYEQNPVSVSSAFFSHNAVICDDKSRDHLKELKQGIFSNLKGNKKWETNLALVLPVAEIPEYRPVEAITEEKETVPTIMVGGAFFMEDKDYDDFCDRLEKMGNKVIRQKTGNDHTFEEYSRFMEDVEIDFMSAKDPNLQAYNPMKEVVEKIDRTLAENGYPVPDMVIIPDKAKEAAEKKVYNGVSILENERKYYYRAFEGKEKKPQVKSETYEYEVPGKGKVSGSMWQSPAVHNEKLPDLRTVLSEYGKTFTDMADYTAERTVSNTLSKMEKLNSKGSEAPEMEKTVKQEKSVSAGFGL